MTDTIQSQPQAPQWQDFLRHQQEISDLHATASLLHWDQNAYLPAEAAAGRGRQLAQISRIIHAHQTDSGYGKLLEALAGEDLQPEQRRMLELAQRDFEQSAALPEALVSEMAEHFSQSYNAWAAARPASDWQSMVPLLERSLELTLKRAEFSKHANPHDHYIDEADEGMSADTVAEVFEALRLELAPMLRRLTEAAGESAPLAKQLTGQFAAGVQLGLAERISADYGYDFGRGRQDLTPHPFMIRLGENDVRITTRVREDDPLDALYSTLHETGHALYEQGIRADFLGTPLGSGTSSGVHESQSRLWENLVGRSAAFWEAYAPAFRSRFSQLSAFEGEDFYRACNVVQPSLIRVDADEVSYNLHVIIRFGLERELLAGRLAVRDLAEAWQAAYLENLGVSASELRDGVLQDVHWFGGPLAGAFHSYALGNIMSGQFFAAAQRALPELEQQIAKREFAPLLGWLQQNIYQHGRLYKPAELVERVTGKPLSSDDYLAYLRKKYSGLYGVQL